MQPAEFRYQENARRPSVRRLRSLAKRWLRFDPAPPQHVTDDLAAMYFDGDEVATALVRSGLAGYAENSVAGGPSDTGRRPLPNRRRRRRSPRSRGPTDRGEPLEKNHSCIISITARANLHDLVQRPRHVHSVTQRDGRDDDPSVFDVERHGVGANVVVWHAPIAGALGSIGRCRRAQCLVGPNAVLSSDR